MEKIKYFLFVKFDIICCDIDWWFRDHIPFCNKLFKYMHQKRIDNILNNIKSEAEIIDDYFNDKQRREAFKNQIDNVLDCILEEIDY